MPQPAGNALMLFRSGPGRRPGGAAHERIWKL